MDPQAIIEVFRRNVTHHYLDMKGRVRRQEFWYFMVACVVIYVVGPQPGAAGPNEYGPDPKAASGPAPGAA